MGTTLTALLAGDVVRVMFTLHIEGVTTVFTDGDPAIGLAAYLGSNTNPFADDITGCYGGLAIMWDGDQRVSPWKPSTEPGIVKVSLAPALDDNGVERDFGETVFKRTGGNKTELRAAIDCNDTTITAARVDDFAASGALHIGPERIAYSSRDTGADTFTVSQRGVSSPLLTDTGARFARSHAPLTATEVNAGIPASITDEPRTWVGRYVTIWIHRVVGSEPDLVEADQSGAHLAFAGQIVERDDADGRTWFTCEDVRRKIYETRIMRDPFRARIAEGIWLPAGQSFSVETSRSSSSADSTGNGNDLVVVSGAPASANEIREGRYSAAELGANLNAWLQGERSASRILFNLTYQAHFDDGGTTRGALRMSDPTAGAGVRRAIISSSLAPALTFLGWSEEVIASIDTSTNELTLSPESPRRWSGDIQGEGITLEVSEPTGTYIDQRTYLPQALQHTVQLYTGILKIGELGYVRAKKTGATTFVCTGQGVDDFFGASGVRQGLQALVDGEEVSLEVTQYLLMESTFANLFLQMLLSTGTTGYNSATYDVLAEQLGVGVPYMALGSGFVEDVTDLAAADAPAILRISSTTRFQDLFDADLILRRAFFTWGAGRLQLRTWATPTSTYASATLDETTKAAPVGRVDLNRAAVSQVDDFKNVVTIRYNLNAQGEYQDELVLRDAVSIREHGERAVTIQARNSGRTSSGFSPIDVLIGTFAGFFGFTSRPWDVLTRSMDLTRFEATTPGTVLSVTDKYIRDPSTGLRYDHRTGLGGLSGYPGMVVGQQFEWGGSEGDGKEPNIPLGEVSVMLSPINTQAVYAPCAQVDDTAANGGLTGKTLTLYAHEHSEASQPNDATHLSAGDVVVIVEIDPDDPAAPQTWTDTIASTGTNAITLGSVPAGYDTTGATKYRVIYAPYASATSTQKAKCYQADDADALIVDTVQPYSFAFFGGSQQHVTTSSPATLVPARHATLAFGDGKPLDVGYERDAARLANNLISYKTAWQSPTAYNEVRNYTGAGTWRLVEIAPRFLGRGGLTAARDRLLSLAPRMRSTTGGTASVRVTLGRRRPNGASPDDATRTEAYLSLTFTSTSTSFAVATAQTVSSSHVKMTDSTLGGIGWLYVEVSSIAEYTGLARAVQGAVL